MREAGVSRLFGMPGGGRNLDLVRAVSRRAWIRAPAPTRSVRFGDRMSTMKRTMLTFMAAAALASLFTPPAVMQSSARLLVLNKEDAALAIVDPASGRVLGR